MIDVRHPDYQCPGESYIIERAVHLERLAAFDNRCQGCPHRHDTGSLPVRLVQQLQARWQRAHPELFDDEGVSGYVGEDLNPTLVRRLASALAMLLADRLDAERPHHVVLAGDGRAATADLVVAASEGLRWSGCDVIELPAATTASLLFSQHEYRAAGSLLVGNADGTPRTASVRCFGPGGQPIPRIASESDLSLAQLRRHFELSPNRPGRRSGGWRRGSAETAYLRSLSDFFHALRPLRFLLDTSSAPVERQLNQLLTQVGCRAFSPQAAAALPPEALHFRIWIDGDGERCRVSDERGEAIDPQALLARMAEFLGMQSVEEHSARSQTHRLLSEQAAAIAGGASGRFWFPTPWPAPDALRSLAVLLAMLSQSDRPLSAVLSTSASGCSRTSKCP